MTKWLSLLFITLIGSALTHATPILHTLQGDAIPLEKLHGKWVFINYWASWCEPCLAEIELFNQLYQKKNVALFGVNVEGLSPQKQMKIARANHLIYPSLSEENASLLFKGDLNAIPATIIFNPEGAFQEIRYGTQTAKSLNAIVRQTG